MMWRRYNCKIWDKSCIGRFIKNYLKLSTHSSLIRERQQIIKINVRDKDI